MTTRAVDVLTDMTGAGQFDYDDVDAVPQSLVNGSFEETPMGVFPLGWELVQRPYAQAQVVPFGDDYGNYGLRVYVTDTRYQPAHNAQQRFGITPGPHSLSFYEASSHYTGNGSAATAVYAYPSWQRLAVMYSTLHWPGSDPPTFTVPSGISQIVIRLEVANDGGGFYYWDAFRIS